MIRSKLLYAVLLAIAVLFFILYRGTLSLELLIFAALFPVILWLSVVRIKYSVSTELRRDRESVRKGEPFRWILCIRNKSLFSTPHATADIEYRNGFTGKTEHMRLSLPVMPRNTQLVRLTFHGATCGIMHCRVTGMRIYDPLKLFSRRLRMDLHNVVTIMPTPTAQLPPDWLPQPQPDMDSEEFSKDKAGDDPSEIFDYHFYRAGDAISRIHWKLSSKHDELIVKEYSLPLTADCILLVDYRHTTVQPESAYRIDTMLSALSAVVQRLSEAGISFRLARRLPEGGLQQTEPLSSLQEAGEWIRYVMQTTPLPQESGAAFLEMLRELPIGRVILLTPYANQALLDLLQGLQGAETMTLISTVTEEPQSAAAMPFCWIRVNKEIALAPVSGRADSEDDLPEEGSDAL